MLFMLHNIETTMCFKNTGSIFTQIFYAIHKVMATGTI